TTNVWTLGQQYVLFTKFPAPAVAGTAGAGSTPSITTAKPSLRPGLGRGRKTDPPPAGQPGDARTGGQAPASGKPAAGSKPAAANGADDGSEGRGGMLRRFGLGRSEPAPEQPAEPDVKLVRQQRQRQSRSKRTGKG